MRGRDGFSGGPLALQTTTLKSTPTRRLSRRLGSRRLSRRGFDSGCRGQEEAGRSAGGARERRTDETGETDDGSAARVRAGVLSEGRTDAEARKWRTDRMPVG